MGARLAQRSFSGGNILFRCFQSSFGGLQAGGGIVAGLLAHDALFGQCDNARGVRLLVLQVGLGLSHRGTGRAHLGFGVDGGAGGFAAILPRGLDCLVQLPLIAREGGLRSFARGLQVIVLDDGDKLTHFHFLAFFHGQRLNAAGDLGAYQHFIRIDGANQLQVAGRPRGEPVPDERAQREQAQDQENSISCVHKFLTSRSTPGRSCGANAAAVRHLQAWVSKPARGRRPGFRVRDRQKWPVPDR